MANFPSSTPAVGAAVTTNTLAQQGHTALHNNHSDEIVALATKIGTGSSTPAAGSVLRATGSGTSTWGGVVLTTDVSGTLGVGNGGTGTTSSTGTGSVVLSTAPSLSTPVVTLGGSWSGSPTLGAPIITSFNLSQHDHTNGTGGGQLGFGALLATIFSGQIQTQANAGTAGGTMSYINLGGIKLLWVPITGAAATTTYTVTFPASFFTTTPVVTQAVTGAAGSTTGQYVVTGTVATTGFSWYSGTNPQSGTGFIVIGT